MSKNVYIERGPPQKKSQTNINNNNKKRKKKNNGQNQQRSQITRSVPIARATTVVTRGPKIVSEQRGTMRLQNREFLGNVVSQSANFQVPWRFRINPASKSTFPWLNKIAVAFETYKFHKLQMQYMTRTGATTIGCIIMSPDYDASDRQVIDENEAAMNQDTVETVVWENKTLTLSPARMNAAFKQHFTCPDDRFDRTSQDAKTLDAGQIFVGIASAASGSSNGLGKLWIDYDVSLSTPQVVTDFPSGGAGSNKTAGITANAVNVFTSPAVATLNQEIEPIVKLLENNSFPGPDLFEFTKDWKGYVTKSVTGTTVTDVGAITKNGAGLATSIAPNYNSGGTVGTYQAWGDFQKGDLLGSGTVLAATISSIVQNLGASSII